MRDEVDQRAGVHLPWVSAASNPMRTMQRIFSKIRQNAGLPAGITFTSFRHGGHTDAANAGLSDAQLRALSGHRTPRMVELYAKRTMDQRRGGARQRLVARRTKRGDLSE